MRKLSNKLIKAFQDKEYADAYIDEFLNSYIATQIKVLREKRGLTQKDLAELTGMKQSRIALLENVNYNKWSITTLKKLSEAFDVTLKVSFETFSDTIKDIENFCRESLERESRESDLSNIKIAYPTVLHSGSEIHSIADSKSAGSHNIIKLNLASKLSIAENQMIAI